jgi:RHS repeat-associated protein
MVSLTSAQGWTYAYDGKNRLQSAVRTNAAGQPQFREEYTYDAGDNMLTKQNYVFDLASSISDDFDDGDYTAGPAWTVASGSWAVEPTSLFLMNTGTTADSIWTANTNNDVEFFGPYMLDTVNDPANNYLEFVLRYSSGGTDQVSVRVYEGKMQLRKVVSGVATTVDFNDVDSPAGDAFGLWARCIGSTLQVLRAADGTGWRVVAEMTGVPTTATTRVYLNTSGDMTAFVNDINYFAHKTTADSFADDFTASTLGGGWSATGSYSVVGNTLNGTNAAGYATVSRANTSADNQLKVSLKKTSSLNSIRLYVRSQDSNNQVWVETWGTAMQIVQRSGGVNTTLASASVTTTLNTWYDYHIISDGNRIEVWRGPQGGTTELLLETDAATVLGSAAMMLETRLCTASFDNVQYITNDPATQTMAYNGANELTSSVVGAITTTYTYDQHGRTISKADGTHSARYIWFAGDKLKQYESDFPGEEDVAYNYDALGKRRVKLVNLSAPTDADYTWYRWDASWNIIGEYAAGSIPGTTWDLGALSRWYVRRAGMKFAYTIGQPGVSSHAYVTHDWIGTESGIFNQAKVLIGRSTMSAFGQAKLVASGEARANFAGHPYDEDSKLFAAAFRLFDGATSRWISREPFLLDGPNLYQYGFNNPVNGSDRLGLWFDIPLWMNPWCISYDCDGGDSDAPPPNVAVPPRPNVPTDPTPNPLPTPEPGKKPPFLDMPRPRPGDIVPTPRIPNSRPPILTTPAGPTPLDPLITLCQAALPLWQGIIICDEQRDEWNCEIGD